MFIQTILKKTKTKTYKSVVLMESYRENGKVKHRIISNLTNWPEKLVNQLDQLLKGKAITNIEELESGQGKSCGGIIVANAIAQVLGIGQALGNHRQGKLAMLQIMGRVFTQCSRLYLAKEWHLDHAVNEVLGVGAFDEDDLYENLDWLAEHQQEIEAGIFNHRLKDQCLPEVYLYDVTSSYLEGDKNELADYGYNRDGKKGKKQIVIGLLCDKDGYPVSVEVFKGNTNDTKTVRGQLQKLKETFGVEKVVFVGDKGMIKQQQIETITSGEYTWNYITTITKPQIESLLQQDIIQLELFDKDLVEVQSGGTRYILRQNPTRLAEMCKARSSRIEKIKEKTRLKNEYLKEHPRAKIIAAQKAITTLIKKLKADKLITCDMRENELVLEVASEEQINEISRLDGCYVIKTDLPKEIASKETIHERYKDLALVESAFRTIKTTLEEIQPIYVRKEARTRGHVLVCMLAYLIIKHIDQATRQLGYTKIFTLQTLDSIQYRSYNVEKQAVRLLPTKLNEHQNKILEKLNIKLPRYL
jgi:transposase